MTTVALIFVVIALYYVGELFLLLPPDAVVFWGGDPLRYRVASHSGIRIRDKLFWVFGGLWPWTRVMVAHGPPIILTEHGVLMRGANTLPPAVPPARACIPYEQVRASVSGATLRVNDESLRMVSTAEARRVCELLEQLKSSSAKQRMRALNGRMMTAFSTREVQRAYRRWVSSTGFLRGASGTLWLYVFAVLPLLVLLQVPISPWRMLAAYGALLVLVQVLFFFSHRRLYPEQTGTRVMQVIAMIVSPAHAMCAARSLGLDVLVPFHPLVVASALGRTQDYQLLARLVLRAIAVPVPHATELPHGYEERVAAFVAKCGGDPDRLARDVRLEPGTVTYCPRCLAASTQQRQTCDQCPDVAMHTLRGDAT